jgi:hypothetical protein
MDSIPRFIDDYILASKDGLSENKFSIKAFGFIKNNSHYIHSFWAVYDLYCYRLAFARTYQSIFMGQLHEKGVSNNECLRQISDKLDQNYFNDHPSQRAIVHSVYHAVVGVGKLVVGNKTGAKAEFKRSAEQSTMVPK